MPEPFSDLDAPDLPPVERLRRATRALLHPDADVSALRPEVLVLGEVLDGASTAAIDPTVDIAAGESRTPGGLALSPTMAAMCVGDYVRTVRFIRGLHAAIRTVQGRIADRPVRVLYAGCGPYATLAVPLMAALPPGSACFHLLDIHSESVASAEAIVATLGLDAALNRAEVADAGAWQIGTEAPPDVIVMEIMQAALEAEPQVPVTRHLMAQAPDALLVPAEIVVDLVLVDPAAEHPSGGRAPDRRRVPLGPVFRLSREAAAGWADDEHPTLPGATVRIPRRGVDGLELMLCTTIRTFGDEVLRDYDSGLTNPRMMVAGRPGDRLQFDYAVGSHPHLRVEVVPPWWALRSRLGRWLSG